MLGFGDVQKIDDQQAGELREQALRGDEDAAVAYVCFSLWKKIRVLKVSKKSKGKLYDAMIATTHVTVKYAR